MPLTSTIDPQYARVIAAEKRSGLLGEPQLRLASLPDAGVFVKGVTEDARYLSAFGPLAVRLKPTLVDRSEIHGMGALAIPYANIMIVSDKGLNKLIILHELAHLTNRRSEAYFANTERAGFVRPVRRGHSSHGAWFVQIYLQLMEWFLPEYAGRLALALAFAEAGVRTT